MHFINKISKFFTTSYIMIIFDPKITNTSGRNFENISFALLFIILAVEKKERKKLVNITYFITKIQLYAFTLDAHNCVYYVGVSRISQG